MQLLFQPRDSLSASHNMLELMQIDVNGRCVWLFYNAIGAVAQCPYNWGVGSAFHPMKIHISFGSRRGRKLNWLVSLFLYQFSSKLLSFLDCSWELYQRKGGFGLWQQFSDIYKALSIFHQGSCKSSTPCQQSMLHLLLFQTAHWMYHPMRADVYNTCAQVSYAPARRCIVHLRAGVIDICAQVLPSQICIL